MLVPPMAPEQCSHPSKSGMQRRRPLPKLRTKTGCLTCRARRKKCDEGRPICVACTRNHILCKWGEPRAADEDAARSEESKSPIEFGASRKSSIGVHDFGETPSPNESSEGEFALIIPKRYVADLNLSAYGLKSSQEADLLRHLSQNLFPTLISSYAHPGFRQEGTFLSASSEPRPLVDALLALSSLYVSNKSTYYDERAVGYYFRSIHDLRKQVGNKSTSGSEDHLLMNVIWLYIFEIWGMRLHLRVGAATHLRGALQILKLRQNSCSQERPCHTFPINRLAAESVLYHLSNIAIYDSSLGSLRVTDVRDVLEPLLSEPPFPDSSSIANCPVLVVPPQMYFLVLETSQLSHCMPLGAADRGKAMQLKHALDELQIYDDGSPFATLDTDSNTRMMYEAAYLYVLAARTLVFLLLNPHESHTHYTIQANANQAISILRTGVMGAPCKQFFCWPLLILGSVLESSDDISFVYHELQAAWDISSCGNVLVVLQVFETVMQRRLAGEHVDTLEFLKIVRDDSNTSIINKINDRVFEIV